PENLREILDHVHPEDRESLLREIKDIRVEPIEKRAVRFSVAGNLRHLRLTLYQVDTSGRPECVGFAEDFTEAVEFQKNILSHSAKKNAILNILRDRKSTRLNSSHVKISYAVFCLKKKGYDVDRLLERSKLSKLIMLNV